LHKLGTQSYLSSCTQSCTQISDRGEDRAAVKDPTKARSTYLKAHLSGLALDREGFLGS
jgi:hypothetical protein